MLPKVFLVVALCLVSVVVIGAGAVVQESDESCYPCSSSANRTRTRRNSNKENKFHDLRSNIKELKDLINNAEQKFAVKVANTERKILGSDLETFVRKRRHQPNSGGGRKRRRRGRRGKGKNKKGGKSSKKSTNKDGKRNKNRRKRNSDTIERMETNFTTVYQRVKASNLMMANVTSEEFGFGMITSKLSGILCSLYQIQKRTEKRCSKISPRSFNDTTEMINWVHSVLLDSKNMVTSVSEDLENCKLRNRKLRCKGDKKRRQKKRKHRNGGA